MSRVRCCACIDEWIANLPTQDADRVRELRHSRNAYLPHETERKLACVGLKDSGAVLAVALMEHRIDSVPAAIVLWDVSCKDTSSVSGTRLVKAMQSVAPSAKLGETIHPRWRVASAFYAPAHDRITDV